MSKSSVAPRKAVVLAPGKGRAYPMGRISAVFKADQEETGSRYSVSEWWLGAGTHGPGAHSHAEDDLFYVIEGVMSIRVDEEWFACPKGSFVLVPGGVTHDFENRGRVRAGVLNFSSPGPFEPEMPGIVEWFARNPPKDVSDARPARSIATAATAIRSTKSFARTPALLAGGNPQVSKADGDAPVQAYIAAMPGWKRDVGQRLDALIVRNAPDVRKAVRWNSPLYGLDGRGWFLGLHVFTRYVKVTFFRGTSLRPVPPGGTGPESRWIDVHEDDFDAAQMASWIRQAAAIPGWDGGSPRLYGGVALQARSQAKRR